MLNNIAILSTGDELVHGDILNTTGPWLAQHLIESGFTVSTHYTVSDIQSEIEKALEYLLSFHRVVITTGGLGPTSDDRTRFAISAVLCETLVFDETSWQQIKHILTKYHVPITENNRQQALFPQNATVLTNAYGTANGCIIQHQDKTIIMLPGPPKECESVFMPIGFDYLLSLGIHHPRYVKKWRVFGVSESHIATTIDEMMKTTDSVIGYRIDYPYIEIKLFSPSQEELDKTLTRLSPFVEQFCLQDSFQKATDKLALYFNQHPISIFVEDKATYGYWQSQLFLKTEDHALRFCEQAPVLKIELSGLNALFKSDENPPMHTDIRINISFYDQTHTYKSPILFRGKRTLYYASEIISDYVLKIVQLYP
jgi:nicotinamide-nucleotide amidase